VALYEEAKEIGLAEAAGKRDIPVDQTGLFDRGGAVPGIGFFQAANVFAFMAEEKEVSEPLMHDDVYYVLEVARRDSSRIPDLEEARDMAMEDLARRKRLESAREEAERFAGRDYSLETIARRADRNVREASLISRAGTVPGVGSDLKLILAAFASPEGETAGPIHTEAGSFYLKQNGIRPVNEEQYQAERAVLLRSLLAQRQEAAFNAWLEAERERADVEDYRPKDEDADQG